MNLKQGMMTKNIVVMLFVMLCIYITVKAHGFYDWKIEFANVTQEHTNDSIVPSFPGGDNALFDKLKKEVHYPQVALENGIEGYVVIQFKVNKDSTISELTTLKDNGSEYCSKEVIRVLKKISKWNPAIKDGQPISAFFVLKAYFSFEYIKNKNETKE